MREQSDRLRTTDIGGADRARTDDLLTRREPIGSCREAIGCHAHRFSDREGRGGEHGLDDDLAGAQLRFSTSATLLPRALTM